MRTRGSDLSIRWNAVCIDCRDANELADFYAGLLGWRITTRDGDWIHLSDPSGGVGLNIQAEPWYEPPVWPEAPPAQCKMMHFEIHVDDVERAVRHAERLGAQQAPWQTPDRDPSTLRVMLDPAGHPFCLWTE
jgi:catechol 2,3-dioxygenase-like lactoylglutathione lyase family enzyme